MKLRTMLEIALTATRVSEHSNIPPEEVVFMVL